MTKRNSMGRAVWFKRVLWSYVPIHWVGFVATAGIVFVTLPLVVVANHYRDGWGIIPFLIGLIAALSLAARHSR